MPYKKRTPLTPEQQDQIAINRMQGMSIAANARESNCTEKQVRLYLEKEGDLVLHTTPETEARYKRICELRDKGYTYTAMSPILGVSYETILQTRKRHENHIPKEYLKLTDEIETGICDCYKSGHTIVSIMSQFKICDTRVYSVLFKHNVALRQPNVKSKVPTKTVKRIVAMANKGISLPDIAKRLQLANSTVYRIMNRYKTHDAI
jgi:Mor family transcriptional regulator